jgi:hypothetical protein
MTAPASPYRLVDSPLMAYERVLEQELATARQMLDAYSNEEVRIGRRALVGEATKTELAEVTAIVESLILRVDHLNYQLASVRTEIHWRGERKLAAATPHVDGPLWPLWIGAVVFASFAVLCMWGST